MKKIGKLKKCGIAAAAVPVSLAVMLTGFSFVDAKPSYAAAADKTDLFENIVLENTCDYGATFDVPVSGVSGATVTVTAPNGTDVSLGDEENGVYKVTAVQIGNYTVTYKNGDEKYSHNVYVTLDEDYFLRVDDNGADIPTYMAKDGSFEIPGAQVAYYDDDSMLQSYPADLTTLTIKDSNNKEYSVGDKFEPAANGKTYLTYSAQIGGSDGLKYFNQTFEINVQSTFSDTSAPTLSVSGVTSEISLNRAVKLPVATATDNYDENIKIEVKVIAPDGEPAKLTDVNEYGYAEVKSGVEYGSVVFDNDKAMTFYPTISGDYTVSYVATDDAGNKSAVREYRMTARDVAAPVFYSIADDQIPDTWGMEVFDENGTVQGKGGKITFPVPEIVDNVSHMYKQNDEDDDLISLLFRITDSDNSRVVVEFTNILVDGDDNKFQGSTYGDPVEGVYPEISFNRETGFEFDFSKYNRTDSSGAAVEDLSGTYTVYYRARDKAQNTSSKTYTINLQEDYEDKAAPSTAEVTVPSYLSAVADKMFTVPSPAVADANDSRPTVDYRLYNENKEYIAVKGGEEAEIETRSDGTYLVIDDDAIKLGDYIYYYVSVTDKVGNNKSNFTNVNDFTTWDSKTRIVEVSDPEVDGFSYNGAIEFKNADNSTITAGDTVNAGGFTIEDIDLDMRKLTGFEVFVTNPTDDVVSVTLDTVSVEDNNKAKIYVSNIKFKASVKGTYHLTVRAFDANGVSSAYGYSVVVAEGAGGDDIKAQAATIGSRADVNVKYQLHNDTIDLKGNDVVSGNHYFVARRISGWAFSLIGSEFTARTNGSYSVQDGYIAVEALTSGFDFDNATKYGTGAYSFSVQDNSAPVIEVQGIMPTYAAKDTDVKLPFVIASSPNGKAEVTLVVKNEKSKEVKTTKLSEVTDDSVTAEDKAKYEYSFKGTSDGKYTATYTATYANATPVTQTFTINVGDVEGPEFTIKAGTGTAASSRMKVGDTFTFGTMELDNAETGVTITKKLLDPSREEVTEATVSGSYDSHREDKYNGWTSKDEKSPIKFTMAGQYEVVYTATDSVGNVTTQRYTITVVSSGSGKPTTITTLSTVLIIVAVVLLAGVIVYVVRFRKVKVKK